MPCDGVAVMQFQLDRQAEAKKDVLEVLRPYIVDTKTINGVIKMAVALPMPNGQRMPVRIAIEASGRITAITTTGTFEVGKGTLEQWVKSLQAKGVSISGLSFEQHRHDHHAPQLAYTQAQR